MESFMTLNNIGCVVLVMSIIVVAYFLAQKSIQEKSYYKKIIDNSTNIVVVSDSTQITTANKTFFKYFTQYENLQKFSKRHQCISEFFELEEGYLKKPEVCGTWMDYLIQNTATKHKVKVKIENEVFYFLISASLLDEKRNIYAMILSDITEQESTKHKLISMSERDKLTNIGNRKYYDDVLCEHITLAQRYNHAFSLVLLDIDHFKKINDSLGHDTGDKVLQEYTKFIGHHLRDIDMFCRVGGEEFVLILPDTTKDKAYMVTQKLRLLVENHKTVTPITMSFGVVEYEKGDDEESIFKRADRALYRAKDTGRNKVFLG